VELLAEDDRLTELDAKSKSDWAKLQRARANRAVNSLQKEMNGSREDERRPDNHQ